MTELMQQEAEHSSLGPSGAYIWMNCAASIGFCKREGIVDDEGEEAARGTVAHAIMAECLLSEPQKEAWEFSGEKRKEGKWEFEVDEEMVLSVQTMVDFVNKLMKDYAEHSPILYVETRVRSRHDKEAYGTADIRIEVPPFGDKPGLLIIVDFKNGFVVVEPDTEQLKLYGEYSYDMRSPAMRGQNEPMETHLYVVQPRAAHPKGPIRKYVTTPGKLSQWMEQTVLPAIAATRDPNAQFTMGDWCKYCKANTSGRCPAVFKEIQSLPIGKPTTAFTSEELVKFRALKPVAEKFFEGVNKELTNRAINNKEQIKGICLVWTGGKRKYHSMIEEEFVDETDGKVKKRFIKVEEAAVMTFGEDAFEKPELKSPAQIEKMPGGKAFASRWASKPQGIIVIADEDDPRERAVGLMDRLDNAAANQDDTADVDDTVPI